MAAPKRSSFNPFQSGGQKSSPAMMNPDSLFSDPYLGGGGVKEIIDLLPTLPPEKIKQILPTLPPEVLRQVAPSIPLQVMQEILPTLPPEIAQEIAPPDALKAVESRRDANEATRTATDQYEADVADFKNTQATEAEQGIASLPQSPSSVGGKVNPDSLFSDPFLGSGAPPFSQYDDSQLRQDMNSRFSNIPQFDDSNIQDRLSQLGGRFDNIPQFDDSNIQDRLSQLGGRFDNIPQFDDSNIQDRLSQLGGRFDNIPQFDDSNIQDRLSQLGGRFDNIPQFDDSGIQDRLSQLGGRFDNIPQFDDSNIQDRLSQLGGRFDNIPQFDDSNIQDRLSQLGGRFDNIPQFDDSGIQGRLDELGGRFDNIPQFDDSQLRRDFNSRFETMTQPDLSGLATTEDLDNRFSNIPSFDETDIRALIEENRRMIADIGPTQGGSGNPYSNVFTPGGYGLTPAQIARGEEDLMYPPYQGGGIPPSRGGNPPGRRGNPPPGGGLPPGGEPLPDLPPGGDFNEPPPYEGPVNPYTGEFIQNPYQPYSTESGATPLIRKMSPEEFGQAPMGRETQRQLPRPQPPRLIPPRGPKPRPRDPWDDSIPFGANSGGYLNTGISQLPMNGQGDTLTRQVFQSGFRPRR